MKTTELVELIPQWIKKKVEASGSCGTVVGLSGGVDSAVVAALCKKAVGDNVLGVLMPCESSPLDQEDAEEVANALGIKTLTVDLDSVLASFLEVLPTSSTFARSNMKPRLRMAALYYLANTHSYLVVGTGNKSELMVGYYTKHGDGGVDLLPIADLFKSEVRELAVELHIPRKIIEKPPSAGLWEGQTDEKEMGVSYHELEGILRAIESGKSQEPGNEMADKVKGLISRSEHKRALPPVFEVKR